MKQKLIATIRAVPISGRTYEEYVEAVADRLLAEGVYARSFGVWNVEEYRRTKSKFIVCSECRSVIDSNFTHINEFEFDYCPYCGAKMLDITNENN